MKEYKKELLGFTAGNFDLLHPGYINCFKDAKNYCDKFIIFLQNDPSLHRKSKYKPVVPLYDRYKTFYRNSIHHQAKTNDNVLSYYISLIKYNITQSSNYFVIYNI